MGNLCSKSSKCPLHQDNYIENVCLHPRCIQPLCPKCLPHHHQQHQAIGSPPILRPVEQLSQSLSEAATLQNEMYHKNNDFSESVRRVSTADMLKELTREYFIRKRPALTKSKDIALTDLLLNLQMAEKMKDPDVQVKLRSFFKENLVPNHQLLEEQYRPLYR